MDILLDCADHPVAVLVRAAGDVRRDQRIIELPQWMALRQRLRIGNIDAGARQTLGVERLHQRVHVINPPRLTAIKYEPFFISSNCCGPSILWLFGVCGADTNTTSAMWKNFIELVGLHNFLHERRKRNVFRIDTNDVHSERVRADSDLRADAANPDDYGGTSIQLDIRHTAAPAIIPAACAAMNVLMPRDNVSSKARAWSAISGPCTI